MTKPALTPEEWAEPYSTFDDEHGIWPIVDDDGFLLSCDDSYYSTLLSPGERHALAALCLHGQPFGFTWDDVALLREAAGYVEACRTAIRTIQGAKRGREGYDEVMDLASRIEALLPRYQALSGITAAPVPPEDGL
jgi:hypothetical protein